MSGNRTASLQARNDATDKTEPEGSRSSRLVDVGLPVAVFLVFLAAWETIVALARIPPYILPAPSVILATLIKDWPLLSASLMVTLTITFEALALAIVGGVGLAILLAQSRWIERAFLPFAIILQVTPVIAIAPLLLVWLEPSTAVLVCAFIVAFFPILSNTALGLASTDHNLLDLFELYRASRWKQLIWLRLPAALPYFFLSGHSRRRALSRLPLSGQELSGAKRMLPAPAPPRPSARR